MKENTILKAILLEILMKQKQQSWHTQLSETVADGLQQSWHAQPSDTVLDALNTNATLGLSTKDAAIRQQRCSMNNITEYKGMGPLGVFLCNFINHLYTSC